MALEKVTTVSGRGVYIPGGDIDTDRIIPARFMKCVTFDGLGEFAFYDVRFNPDTGEKTDHPLNDERFSDATILLAGVIQLVDENEVRAIAVWRTFLATYCGRRFEIDDLVTAEGHRSKGYGATLIKALEAKARSLSCTDVMLTCVTRNTIVKTYT